MSTQKKTKRNPKLEKEFEQVIQSLERDQEALKTPPSQVTLFFVVGFAVAAIPFVLYIPNLADASFGLNAVVFLGSAFFTGVVLSHAYNGVAMKARNSLFISRSDNHVPSESIENSPILVGARAESASYALFTVNTTFLALYLLFAFYIFRSYSIAPHYHFLICTSIPSLLGFAVSKAF